MTTDKEMTETEFDTLRAMVLAYGMDHIVAMAEYIAEAEQQVERRNADRIDGYDRDDLGESPDY